MFIEKNFLSIYNKFVFKFGDIDGIKIKHVGLLGKNEQLWKIADTNVFIIWALLNTYICLYSHSRIYIYTRY